MTSKRTISEVFSVEGQTIEQDERFEVVDETPELRPSVEQTIQGTVDTNHPDAVARETTDGRLFGQTLAAEERIQAREAELRYYGEKARKRERRDGRPEVGNRVVVEATARNETRAFEEGVRERAIGRTIPPAEDPRETLSQEELSAVNRTAQRLAGLVRNGPSRATLSRRVAERVERGQSVVAAAVGLREEVERESGVRQDIADIESWQYEASVKAEVARLWSPKSRSQQQVGLLKDETGTIKFTVWRKSKQGVVLREDDRVWVQAAKVNQYQRKPTLAADSRTVITRLGRGDGYAPVHGGLGVTDGERKQDIAFYKRSIRRRRKST